jgi:hypothetical protein
MDKFGYLSVLLSIIIGLAITDVLQGYRQIILARSRVSVDATPLIWSALVLLFAAQSWWASFGLATHSDWTFLAFLTVLLQSGLLYMLAAVILPEIPDEGRVDLGAHFADHRRVFFGFLIAMLATSVTKDVVLDGRLPHPLNLFFHVLLALTALIGIVAASRKIQLTLPIVATLWAGVYIALLFARL